MRAETLPSWYPISSLRNQPGFQEFNPGVHSAEGGRCPGDPLTCAQEIDVFTLQRGG